MSSYKRNPSLMLAYCFLRYFMFFIPIFTPFLLGEGLTYSQIFMIHFTFGISVLVLEIPVGYLTDRIGRKRALFIGSIIMASALFMYGSVIGFWLFVLAEFVLAIGFSFYSGTYQALLYDSLLHLKKEKLYKKWAGYALAFQRGAEIIASFLVSFIVVFGMKYTFYFSMVPLLISLPVIFLMKEPKIKKEPVGIGHWHHFGKVVKDAYNHPAIFWFSMYFAVFTGTMLTGIWLFQSLWTEYEIALVSFGLLWVALQVFSGSGSLSAHYLEKKLGLHFSLVIIIILLFLGIILSAILPSPYSLITMCLCMFLWGFSVPVSHDAVNKLVVSSRRATVLSFKSMLMRVFHTIFTLLVAVVLVSFSLSFSLILLAGIFLVISGFSLYKLHDHGVL
ncbi:hypothetical protein COV16_07135 [Candidatus Woesearchaeota archaeon CG10_big_fil_rev_8_21_14_0_10_34_8]|nr:MAG: hypothetical protein COV16_07135 [Candidatus Woesearchaeota archaeon CG10_big_fil_rev_8_21_14_0_10_34_8]